jgi:hypothetical protein
MKFENETYLGDGLYASFDGWMIKLRAPREDGDHWVGLDPDTMELFSRWRIKQLEQWAHKSKFKEKES